MSKNETNSNWTERRMRGKYNGIPNNIEVTKENCREFVPYWIRLRKDGGERGVAIHIPSLQKEQVELEVPQLWRDEQTTQRQSVPLLNQEQKPLCYSRSEGGRWQKKDLSVFPPPWDKEKLCDKCIEIINERDYMRDRGKGP